MSATRSWPHPEIKADLALLRAAHPLTHCLTSGVVAGFTANVLLALGAAPAMVMAEEEVGGFTAGADALLVNLGTMTAPMARSALVAVEAAQKSGKPFVLDPVAVGALGLRTRLAAELLACRPTVVRGNASEILALAGASSGGRGVDSTAGSSEALDHAQVLARRSGAVVAVSGALDYITDGVATIEVPGGDEVMTRVTGVGCSLGAAIAAFLGAGVPALRAASAASALYARAGERAAASSRGPGSFAVAFLDELALIGLDGE